MPTLLLRFVAPMQSWGTRSKFDDRDTEAEPSKSGVLGLCAAALGIDRSEPLGELLSLGFGVRIDRKGSVGRDYHTAQLEPHKAKTSTDVTTRYYLADAAFWVGLEGDTDFLEKLNESLKNPHWPLSLGRKAFQPSLPIFTDMPLDTTLFKALEAAPSLRQAVEIAKAEPYTFVLDRNHVPSEYIDTASPSERQDEPITSFAIRQFYSRDVLTIIRKDINPEQDELISKHPRNNKPNSDTTDIEVE